MNIEIANRLVRLRKQNGLSQEELASRLGISRQAVSKWERAEASPDTDNLILLAREYGVSLDELLRTEDELEELRAANPNNAESRAEETDKQGDANADFKVFVGDNSIKISGLTGDETQECGEDEAAGVQEDVKPKKKSFYINKNGKGIQIHIGDEWDEGEGEEEARMGNDVEDENHDFDDDFDDDDEYKPFLLAFPYPVFCAVMYLIMGFVWDLWHPGWIIFITIPIYYPLVNAILGRGKKPLWRTFPYPIFCLVFFLVLGCVWGLWHPAWIIFMTIPIYYPIVNALGRKGKRREQP